MLCLHGTAPIRFRSRTVPCLFTRDRSGASPVLNQREHICCFHQLRMCRTYEAVSKWRCWNQNEPIQVFTRYWSNLGPERFQNWTCFFAGLNMGPKPHQIGGMDSRSCVNRRPIRTDFLTGTFSCEHSLNHARVAQISKS